MKIRITGGGIYGADGEVPIGTELTLKSEPKAWAGRYIVLSDDGVTSDKVVIVNPQYDRDDLKKQADELGIQYPANIPSAKLSELIDAELAK